MCRYLGSIEGTWSLGWVRPPPPVTVYIRGPIKGYIYTYIYIHIIVIIQLLLRGGSTEGLGNDYSINLSAAFTEIPQQGAAQRKVGEGFRV